MVNGKGFALRFMGCSGQCKFVQRQERFKWYDILRVEGCNEDDSIVH